MFIPTKFEVRRPCIRKIWRTMCVTINGPGNPDLWPFDLETGLRVAFKVGNLPSKFGHARPLRSWIIGYVRDGSTDGQKQRSLSPSLWAGHNNCTMFGFNFPVRSSYVTVTLVNFDTNLSLVQKRLHANIRNGYFTSSKVTCLRSYTNARYLLTACKTPKGVFIATQLNSTQLIELNWTQLTQLNSVQPSQSCFCLWRHDLQTESTVVHAVELNSVEFSCVAINTP